MKGPGVLLRRSQFEKTLGFRDKMSPSSHQVSMETIYFKLKPKQIASYFHYIQLLIDPVPSSSQTHLKFSKRLAICQCFYLCITQANTLDKTTVFRQFPLTVFELCLAIRNFLSLLGKIRLCLGYKVGGWVPGGQRTSPESLLLLPKIGSIL